MQVLPSPTELELQLQPKRRRREYLCTKCGQPKAGHKCRHERPQGRSKYSKAHAELYIKSQYDMHYKVEYAKSDRSECRRCNKRIRKGALRIARLMPDHINAPQYKNAHGELQDIAHWYHPKCFWEQTDDKAWGATQTHHKFGPDKPPGMTDIGAFDLAAFLANKPQPKQQLQDPLWYVLSPERFAGYLDINSRDRTRLNQSYQSLMSHVCNSQVTCNMCGVPITHQIRYFKFKDESRANHKVLGAGLHNVCGGCRDTLSEQDRLALHRCPCIPLDKPRKQAAPAPAVEEYSYKDYNDY